MLTVTDKQVSVLAVDDTLKLVTVKVKESGRIRCVKLDALKGVEKEEVLARVRRIQGKSRERYEDS